MSNRRAPARLTSFVRTVFKAGVTATLAGTLLVAMPGTAHAAGPWFAGLGGNNANNCLSLATRCATITGVFAKPAFVAGDTINVSGVFQDRVTITKAVNIVGGGAASTTVTANASAATPFSTFTVNIPAANPNQNVSISGLTITGGFSRFGGGISLVAGNLVVNDSVVTNNRAGGVASSTGGGGIGVLGKALGTNQTLVLNRTVVSLNQTVVFSGTAFHGAGIWAAAPVTLNDSTIADNVANGVTLGGGVYNNKFVAADTPTLNASNTVFSGNKAFDGGALFNSASATVTGGSMTGNQVTFQGGAVYNGPFGQGLTPALSLTNTTVDGNSAANLGGGIINLAPGITTMSGGSLSTNTAISAGGLFVAGASVATISGTSVSGNTAASGATLNQGHGGGIFSAGSLTVSGATFAGNKAVASTGSGSIATGWGAGVYVGPAGANDAPTATITNSSFSTGTATIGGGLVVAGNIFGAAGAQRGQLTANTVTLSNNAAVSVGGGAYVGGTATFNDATFDNNTLTAASGNTFGAGLWVGGAVASDVPSAIVDSSDFTSNDPAIFGGAIGVNLASTLTLRNGSTLFDNEAFVGGGLYNAGTSTVTSSAITGNDAFQGGGIYTQFGTTTVDNSVVDSNKASNIGGGAFVAPASTLTVTGGIVIGNSAVGGGGLYVQDGATTSIDGTTIQGNTANGNQGGGIFNSGTLTVRHSTLSGNTAVKAGTNTGFGGAIFSGTAANNTATKLTVDSSTLNGNNADTGSAILTLTTGTGGTNTASIVNSTISGNTTTVGAGTIVAFHPYTLVSGTVAGNTAASGIGGIYTFDAASGIAGTIISGNSGGACFGATTDGGYNLTDTAADATSCGFSGASNDVEGDPQLGPLAANGGPTATRLPGPSSPAINRIPVSTATGLTDAVAATPVTLCGAGALDQRGITRPQGATCDIGSVEADLSAPTILGPTEVTFTVGQAASFDYTTTGIPTPDLSLAGALPSGVTFTDNGDGTATLAGTPDPGTAGVHPVVTITAANGTDPADTLDVEITVNQPPAINGPATASWVESHPRSVDFTTTGFPMPSLSAVGPLPANLTFTDNGDGTATISGSPALGTIGSYLITITASNGVEPDATHEFTVVVEPAVSVATTSLPDGAVGVPYSTTLAASGGLAPYSWALTGGSLPAGLSLASNGNISGVPTGPAGTSNFEVTVSDSLDPAGTATKQLSITIATGPTTLTVAPVILKLSPLLLRIGVVSATLMGGNPAMPLGGQTVVFKAGATTVCTAVTAANGTATCTMTVANTLLVILNLGVSAFYAGSTSWQPAGGSAGLAG